MSMAVPSPRLAPPGLLLKPPPSYPLRRRAGAPRAPFGKLRSRRSASARCLMFAALPSPRMSL
eukprot:5058083-Pleurochrysis_carterae.AAC.1